MSIIQKQLLVHKGGKTLLATRREGGMADPHRWRADGACTRLRI